MARIRSSTFQGSPMVDVDPDQLTFKRVISNAIGDTALTADILTGDNSPPADSTIDHRGKDGSLYRGCPMGIALAQNVWPTLGCPEFEHEAGTDVILSAQPFYLPRGEAGVDVLINVLNVTFTITAEIRLLSTMAVVTSALLSPLRDGVLIGRLRGLTAGTKYVLTLRAQTEATLGSALEFGPRMTAHFVGFIRSSRGAPLTVPDVAGSPFTVPTTTVIVAGPDAEVMALTDFDATLVADNRAISAFHLSRLNQNQNALDEYLTGAPCAGNAAYALEDSGAGAADPTQSAFHDHSKAGKANEALVDIPIWGEVFGGVQVDGTDAEFDPSSWQPPGLVSASLVTLCQPLLYMPDRPSADGSSGLEVIVLGCSPNSDTFTANLNIHMENAAGTPATTKTAAFAQIGSTRFYQATISDLEFYADDFNQMVIGVDHTSGTLDTGTANTLRILGACAHIKV